SSVWRSRSPNSCRLPYTTLFRSGVRELLRPLRAGELHIVVDEVPYPIGHLVVLQLLRSGLADVLVDDPVGLAERLRQVVNSVEVVLRVDRGVLLLLAEDAQAHTDNTHRDAQRVEPARHDRT